IRLFYTYAYVSSSLKPTIATNNSLSLHDSLPILENITELDSIYLAPGVYDVELDYRAEADGTLYTYQDQLNITDAAETMVISLRSEEHTSEIQSRFDIVCRLLLEKKNTNICIKTY